MTAKYEVALRTFISFHLTKCHKFRKRPKRRHHVKRTTYSTSGRNRVSTRNLTISAQALTFRTLLAPRRNPCAETARLSRGQLSTLDVHHHHWLPSGAICPTKGSHSVQKGLGHTSFVLQIIQTFTPFCYFVDIALHYVNGIINLRLDSRCL